MIKKIVKVHNSYFRPLEYINEKKIKHKKGSFRQETKSQEDLSVMMLNFHLQTIPFIINQEYQIAQLQNFSKQEQQNSFLYELLFQGLRERFLEYSDTKPLIEAFYQTNRITENQYKTLTLHLYLEDKEYEEICNNS